MQLVKLKYRKDIDGLRGIAILLVLTYHFQLHPVTGGFIGVDIFFVISGFLIASLLGNEKTLLPTLVNFYNRRIKRLLPLFLVVSVATTIIAAILMLPEDFINYLKSLRDASLFKSNVLFDRETKNYFAPNARELPLLHTWSLSIEWQFYLLFPALFLLTQKTNSLKIKNILLFSAAIGLAAFSVTTTHSNDAYFLTSARAFELLIGACVAQLNVRSGRLENKLVVLICVISLVGLAMVFTPATPFPGANALAVCILTALTLLYGNGNSVLSNKFLVHTGKISYSAYLWHWPLIAFLAYLQIAISIPLAILLIVLVFLLSHATYIWIEEPGRRSKMPLKKSVALLFLAPVLIIMLFALFVRWNDGFPQRLGDEAMQVYNKIKPFSLINQSSCHDKTSIPLETCATGDILSNRRAILIGDSHARHYLGFVNILADQAHLKVYGLTGSECLILPGAKTGRFSEACAEKAARYYEIIRTGHFNYVLLGQRWIGYPAQQLEYLDAAIQSIIKSGATPVILKSVAEDGTSKRDCFYRHIKIRRSAEEDCSIDRNNLFAIEAKNHVASLFNRIHEKYPSVIFIDPQSVQCQDKKCLTVIDNTPIYEDMHHLSGFGSVQIGKLYHERYGNPFMAPICGSPPDHAC